jgi:hypothetical protein
MGVLGYNVYDPAHDHVLPHICRIRIIGWPALSWREKGVEGEVAAG